VCFDHPGKFRYHDSTCTCHCYKIADPISQDPVNGAQAAGSWACRETFVAVIIGNIPMIYPLFRRGLSKVYDFSTTGLSRYGRSSHSGGNTPGHGNSLGLRSHLSKPARRGKLRSVNALPSTYNDEDAETGWGSDERIMQGGRAVEDGKTNGTVTSNRFGGEDPNSDSHGGIKGIMVTRETQVESAIHHAR
jgi:hypothetical protein